MCWGQQKSLFFLLISNCAINYHLFIQNCSVMKIVGTLLFYHFKHLFQKYFRIFLEENIKYGRCPNKTSITSNVANIFTFPPRNKIKETFHWYFLITFILLSEFVLIFLIDNWHKFKFNINKHTGFFWTKTQPILELRKKSCGFIFETRALLFHFEVLLNTNWNSYKLLVMEDLLNNIIYYNKTAQNRPWAFKCTHILILFTHILFLNVQGITTHLLQNHGFGSSANPI